MKLTEIPADQDAARGRVSQIMEEIRWPGWADSAHVGQAASNVNEDVLANYLKNEYPQTVAVVLSKIRADHAARVLTLLPDPFAMEVVMRMLRMETSTKEVLDGVERTLRAEFMSNLARSARRDSHELMAEIFPTTSTAPPRLEGSSTAWKSAMPRGPAEKDPEVSC